MKKCIINFHFGPRFPYFELQKKSFLHNSNYDFILITDQIENNYTEKNIKYFKYSIDDINKLIHEKISKNNCIVKNRIRKFCDYKIMFGILFENILKDYDWYGWVDSDAILGDLDYFITPDMLEKGEIISGISKYPACGMDCRHVVCPTNFFGPFMLLKNNEKIINLYKHIPRITEMLNHYALHAIEENFLLTICEEKNINIISDYNCRFSGSKRKLINYPRQGRVPCQWVDGKLIFLGFRDKNYYTEEWLQKNGDEGLVIHIRHNHKVDTMHGIIY